MLNGLDLFSGIGGIGLALKPWVRTVAYCECDRYAQGVLLSRMRSGDIDLAPIWDDVRTLRAVHLPKIDIITGGWPCQDLSVAGLRKGLDGERSGLFFEVIRLIRELRPVFGFFENVPGLLVRDMGRVISELSKNGYVGRYGVLSAYDVGAPHLRERIWILAHANGSGVREQSELKRRGQMPPVTESDGQNVGGANPNPSRPRLERGGHEQREAREKEAGQSVFARKESAWDSDAPPAICGVDDGIQNRVDRIRCLGNSVVPQAAREAFERLLGIGG